MIVRASHLLAFVLLLALSETILAGFVWKDLGTKDTSSIGWYTPNSIRYWPGYWEPEKRWLYASTDGICYDQSRRDAIYNYWVGTNYQYVPTTVSFDEQKLGSGFQTGLSGTGWYYMPGLPGTEYWRQDDNGDGRYEEVKVRWTPTFNAGCYNIEVEFNDPNWNGNSGSDGEINVSAYNTTAIGGYRISSYWLWKYCFPRTDDWSSFRIC